MHGALSQAAAPGPPSTPWPQWRRGTRRRSHPALPVPLPRCNTSGLWPGAQLQRSFEEIRVPKKCRRRPGEVRRTWGCPDAHPEGGGRQRTPDPVAHKTPQGLALLPPGLRLSGASSRPPQPRGPPLPGPSAPFILLDSAWGFAGFWEIKTASNSCGAMPGQTGPGGPCAPGYQPGAPCSGGRAQAPAMPPRLCVFGGLGVGRCP